ncbi:MAG: CaiB/BaiF CoA-transferase family protein [Acidimicrobiales bacterium]|jgi:crotonobetainyl-CoA:carnitine CoA-transferase CaiB-like acyl-CoA transferase|nr:CaiB/BaiF CoA-transferase family protein [Acidimicrobiales bacterium]
MVTGPLAGTKVVDLTRFVSGSYATMLLAALGADVMKIEAPTHGDPYRSQGSAAGDGPSPLFASINRGKRSVAIDFRDRDGAEALEALLAGSDFVVHNARPGAMERRGLGFEAVHERHPWIIHAAISAFGDVGPEAGRGGFDLIVQAESGLMGVTGTAESGPVKVGAPVLDIGAGLATVVGIMAAHMDRAETGVGTSVTSSLLEFALGAFTTIIGDVLTSGESPPLLGSHSPSFAPYGTVRARDGYFVLAGAGDEDLWMRLCDVLGRRDLIDDLRFVDNAARLRHREELTREIESVLAHDDVHVWISRLESAGVPAGIVRTMDEVARSAQVDALGILRPPVDSAPRSLSAVDLPFRLGAVRPALNAAPELGAHTREVLREMGVADDLTARLCDATSNPDPR